jgi:hypothetical protein
MAARSRGGRETASESTASTAAAAPSAAPTRDIPPPPQPRPRGKAAPGCSAARGRARRRAVQKAYRILPVIAGVHTKLIQDRMLPLPVRLAVTLVDRPEVLPLRLLPHWQPSSERLRVGLHPKWRDDTPFGYILDGAIASVRFSVESIGRKGKGVSGIHNPCRSRRAETPHVYIASVVSRKQIAIPGRGSGLQP